MDTLTYSLVVAIKLDGEISIGKVITGLAEVGQTATIELHGENGMPIHKTGAVIEVF